MKRMNKFLFSLCLILLFSTPTIVKAESNVAWKIWDSKTEVDIDKSWTIKFNDEVDWDSLRSIKVVRKKDGVPMFIEPMTIANDKKSVVLPLGNLYDFNETYYLSIEGVQSMNGKMLKEPVKMEFQTVNPDFNVEETIVKDGIKFNIHLSQTETKVYAKLKATNVSEKTITYIGNNGCDKGLKAHLITKMNAGQEMVGQKWWGIKICTEAEVEHQLEPGKSIDVIEVLYLPNEPLVEKNYVKVGLVTRSFSNEDSRIPVEIEIPLN